MVKNMRKYTLLRTVGRFFSLVIKSFRAWALSLLYSAIIVIIGFSGILYTSKYCDAIDGSCFGSVFITTFLLILLAMFCYLYDFYQVVFKNGVFKLSAPFKFNKAKIKSIGFIICYIMCFVVSGYFSWKIVQKPANPDWRIEFIYFTVFFVLCMLPVMAMRFSAVVAFYLNDRKFPSLGRLYKLTEGHSYIGIVGFLFVMLLLAIFNLNASNMINQLLTSETVGTGVLKTYLTFLVILFEIGVLLCFFEAQRQLMADDVDSSENTTVEAPKEEAPAIKTVLKKGDGKKKTKPKKKQK